MANLLLKLRPATLAKATEKRAKREKVIINVSGRRFQTWRSTLRKYPDTLLGSDQMLTCFYDDKKKEYFLDRDPEVFRHILGYYQAGKLHVSHEDCLELFYDELKFYGISNTTVHECCWGDCYEMSLKMLKYTNEKTADEQCTMWGKTRGSQFRRMRKTIHSFLEQRKDSFSEKMFQYLIAVFICLSVIFAVIATLRCDGNTKIWEQCYSKVFGTFDMIFMCLFSLEYALRLFATPCFRNFFKDKFNLFDLAAISPFYIDLVRRWFADDVVLGADIWDVFRVLRGIRVLKLARHSWFMQKFGLRLQKALTDLGFLYFAFFLANIFFASCLYTVEVLQGQDTYKSIPDTMWYTVVTMITLGYGDIVPRTILGKIMGAFYCLFGIIILALPVPILQDVGT